MRKYNDDKKPCVILPGVTDEHDYTEDLKTSIIKSGLPWKPVDGCYKGKCEASFVVAYDALTQMKEIAHICTLAFVEYGQESILHLDENRDATLGYHDGNVVDIGHFTEVKEEDALRMDAFTYDPHSGRYWSTVS